MLICGQQCASIYEQVDSSSNTITHKHCDGNSQDLCLITSDPTRVYNANAIHGHCRRGTQGRGKFLFTLPPTHSLPFLLPAFLPLPRKPESRGPPRENFEILDCGRWTLVHSDMTKLVYKMCVLLATFSCSPSEIFTGHRCPTTTPLVVLFTRLDNLPANRPTVLEHRRQSSNNIEKIRWTKVEPWQRNP